MECGPGRGRGRAARARSGVVAGRCAVLRTGVRAGLHAEGGPRIGGMIASSPAMERSQDSRRSEAGRRARRPAGSTPRALAVFASLAAVGLGSGSASAQSVLQTEGASFYVPLPVLSGVRDLTTFSFSSADDGDATLTLPFEYRYLGRPFTEVTVSTNGAVAFGGSCCSAFNSPIGRSSSPNDFIAIWWDDLVVQDRDQAGSHGVFGAAPNRVFVIEVVGLEHYSPSGRPEGRWQLWLYEGPEGRFEVRYDGVLSAAENYSATAGWEGAGGDDVFRTFRPCGSSCDHDDWATMIGTVFSVEVVPGPDLVGSLDGLPGGARPGDTVTGRARIRNVGSDSTSTVTAALYLSLDDRLDASDLAVATLVAPAVPVGGAPVELDISFVLPAVVLPADYLVLLVVDAPNDWAESDETNNLAVSERFFATTGPPRFLLTDRPGTWVPLAQLPGIGDVTEPTFTRLVNGMQRPQGEDADVEVELPFTFNYLGQRFTRATIGTAGILVFGDSALDPYNVSIGDSDRPNNFIAPWWDDLAVEAGTGYVSTGVFGAAPNRVFVVEVRGFEASSFGGNRDGSWQIWLYEGPSAKFEVRLNGVLSVRESYTATPGFEGPGGDDVFGGFAPCASGGYPYCRQADYAGLVGRVFAVQKVRGPELVGELVGVPTGALAGTEADLRVRVRNLGVTDAAPTTGRLLLSADDRLDAGDVVLGTVAVPGVAAEDFESVDVRLPIPAGLPPGRYRVLFEVDVTGAVTELEESNNLAVSAGTIDTAYDLRLGEVTLGAGSAGEDVELRVTVLNGAVPYAGPIGLAVYASDEAIFDRNDPLVVRLSLDLAGDPSESFVRTVRLPALRPGTYVPIGVIDDGGAIREVDEFDNVLAGAGGFVVGPELGVEGVLSPASARPGDPLPLTVRVRSFVGRFAGPLVVRLHLSADASLDAADPVLGSYTLAFAGEPFRDLVQSPVLPANAGPGPHRLIVAVDPGNLVAEADETNNVFVAPTAIESGTDLSVERVVFAPSRAQVGDAIAVSATILARGLPLTGQVAVRAWLAESPLLSDGGRARAPSDLLLGSASLVFAGEARATVQIPGQVPASAAPRSWAVLVEVDADDAVDEPSETNNWGAATSALALAGPNLRVVSVVGPSDVLAGDTWTTTLVLENDGDATADGVRYGYYLAPGGVATPPTGLLFQGGPISVPAGARVTRTDRFAPTVTPPASLRVGVVLDPEGLVAEREEADNQALLPSAIRVRVAGPDLSGRIVRTGTGARAGAPLSVQRAIRNEGVADATDAPYVYVLSLDDRIGPEDPVLARATDSVARGAESLRSDAVPLSASLPAGRYVLGLVLDPDDVVAETEEGNNVVRGPAVTVAGAPLEITTAALPEAEVGADYATSLEARRGPFAAEWWIARGRLPPGLVLDAVTGSLSGRPERAGSFPLTVAVRVGGNTAERELPLLVRPSSLGLALDPSALPPGVVGLAYCAVDGEVRLRAASGRPPYRFEALDGVPPGLELASDGALCGTPTEAGSFTLRIRLSDATGAQVERSYPVRIEPGEALVVRTLALPEATLGEAYNAALASAGGARPHRWRLRDGTVPPGLTLEPDGRLVGTPSAEGSFSFRAEVADARGTTADRALVLVARAATVPAADSGCSCASVPLADSGAGHGAGGGSLGLALLALGVLLRRRR